MNLDNETTAAIITRLAAIEKAIIRLKVAVDAEKKASLVLQRRRKMTAKRQAKWRAKIKADVDVTSALVDTTTKGENHE